MGKTTEIQWADATFNPVRGCAKVSAGCKFCYAETHEARFGQVKWGPNGTRLITSDNYWKQPLKWNREHAERQQEIWENHGPTLSRPRVFCASLSDIFEDWNGPILDSKGRDLWIDESGHWVTDDGLPGFAYRKRTVTMNDVRARLFDLIDKTPFLNWLLLTKRPENILSMWDDMPRGFPHKHRPNCWLGTSIENQEYANQRIPQLLQCREIAPVLFLSAEPLLGPVDLRNIQIARSDCYAGPDAIADDLLDSLTGETCSGETGCVVSDDGPKIDWVISGSESGSNARPANPDWFRSIRDQCAVAFMHKQNGEHLFVDDAIQAGLTTMYDGKYHPYDMTLGIPMLKVGKKAAGRELDGRIHNGFPKG